MSNRDHLARGTPGHPILTRFSRQLSGLPMNDGEIRWLMTYGGVMAHSIDGAAK